MVLIPKHHGSWRFCIYYRQRNAISIWNTYPIQRIDDCMNSLLETTRFLVLDAKSEYWEVPSTEKERVKTMLML